MRFGLRRVGAAAYATVAVLAVMAAGAYAAATPIYLCLAEKAGAAKSGGVEGKCPAPTTKVTYAKVALPKEEAEQQKLLAILPYIKYVASGVGGKPTVQFSGVNVQVVNGEGKTSALNGAGNLIIGYDEEPGSQTGSHDLMLGTKQAYTSYGSILGGLENSAFGANTVVFGEKNLAEAGQSGVLGGGANQATGRQGQVLGGSGNTASGVASVVAGGNENKATEQWSTASGGLQNKVEGFESSISGGVSNQVLGTQASISGGERNVVTAFFGWIGGGYKNNVTNYWASVFGGKELTANTAYAAIP
jgi:hypothetical protein